MVQSCTTLPYFAKSCVWLLARFALRILLLPPTIYHLSLTFYPFPSISPIHLTKDIGTYSTTDTIAL
jgi:hypothetical protein